MKFVFMMSADDSCYIVDSDNKHTAIAKFVDEEHDGNMSDFYYGLDDGQVGIYKVVKEI